MRSAISRPVRLAVVVERPDQLAGEALGAELVVERGVERDRVRAPSWASASSSCASARISTSSGSSATVVAVDVERVARRRSSSARRTVGAVDVAEQRP